MNLALWQSRFGEYLALRNYARRTVASYTGELAPFFAFLDTLGVPGLGDLTRDHIEEYRNHLYYQRYRGRPLTASTQSYRLHAVKAFTRFLARERFLLIDPSLDVELPRVPKTMPRNLPSEREVERVVEAPEPSERLGIRDRAIIEVFYCTGIRSRELRDLKLDQVDFEGRQLRVLGKGSKTRMVPLGDEALDWLREYVERVRPHLVQTAEQTLLFLTVRGKRFHRGPMARIVRMAGRKAGIKKVVTPHVLRHCFATHMLAHGAGLRQLQELLGHESPETTQRYTRLEVTNLRHVVQRCHPRERKAPQ